MKRRLLSKWKRQRETIHTHVLKLSQLALGLGTSYSACHPLLNLNKEPVNPKLAIEMRRLGFMISDKSAVMHKFR
jgi:hypothetical protein